MATAMAALEQFGLDATGHCWWLLVQSKLDHDLLGLIHAHLSMDGGRKHSYMYLNATIQFCILQYLEAWS